MDCENVRAVDIKDIMARHPVFAHRGCWSFGAPENSKKAFRRAVDAGFGIELDVHLLSDGNIVVFHDFSLWRMCFRPGTLEKMTTEEVTKQRLHLTRERIPLFKDVLYIIGGKVPVFIELKCDGNEIELADAVVKELADYDGEYVLISFHEKATAYLKGKGYTVGQLCNHPPRKLSYAPDSINSNIFGAPLFKCQCKNYPPIIPWTISNVLLELKAKLITPCAVYNTKWFLRYRFRYLKARKKKD